MWNLIEAIFAIFIGRVLYYGFVDYCRKHGKTVYDVLWAIIRTATITVVYALGLILAFVGLDLVWQHVSVSPHTEHELIVKLGGTLLFGAFYIPIQLLLASRKSLKSRAKPFPDRESDSGLPGHHLGGLNILGLDGGRESKN